MLCLWSGPPGIMGGGYFFIFFIFILCTVESLTLLYLFLYVNLYMY